MPRKPGKKSVKTNKKLLREVIALPIDFDKTVSTWRGELAKALEEQGKLRGESAMSLVARLFFEDPATYLVPVIKHLLPQLKAVEMRADSNAPFRLIVELGTDKPPVRTKEESFDDIGDIEEDKDA